MQEPIYSELKAAVVALACEDYLNLLAGFGVPVSNDQSPHVSIEELEEFFTGEDFWIFSDLDGVALMEKVRRFAKTMVLRFDYMKLDNGRFGCYRIDDPNKSIIEGSVHKKQKDAASFAASLNDMSVLYFSKCRTRDGRAVAAANS